MKKFSCFLLVACMLMALLTGMSACTDTHKTGDLSGENGSKDPNGSGDADRIPLELSKYYFATDGEPASVHILEWSANGMHEVGDAWIPWEEGDVEQLDGGMLNQAVFNRNATVEEQYGVEITKEYVSVDKGYMTRVRQNSESNENAFQLFTQRTKDIISLVQEQYMFDMNKYQDTILHTDQPWWVQDSVQSFTLGDHLYMAATEMLLRDKGATAVTYFNMDLANDYTDLPNFFDLVDQGEWTMAAMIEACEIVAHSEDGDDLMNSAGDVWGCYGADDPVFHLYAGAGKRFAHIDAGGYMEYDFGKDPETITIMQDIHTDFMYGDWYQMNTVNDIKMPDGKSSVFVGGQSLFYIGGLVKDTAIRIHTMTDTYGILPTPKFDVDQSSHYSLVWMHQDSVIGIPAHTANTEMSAVILEALSWESYYSVFPVFYDTILLDRMAKDKDSSRMLELAFKTRVYDPGLYWDTNTGLQAEGGLWRYCQTGNADIAGLWERFESAVDQCVESINRMVDDLERTEEDQ